ncbi:hypothetical protein QR685DRAFT_451844, partial [Neurospora intermedia]
YNNVLVIIDRFSKIVWIYLYKNSVTVKDAIYLFYKGPFRLFGLPREVIETPMRLELARPLSWA